MAVRATPRATGSEGGTRREASVREASGCRAGAVATGVGSGPAAEGAGLSWPRRRPAACAACVSEILCFASPRYLKKNLV